MLELLHRDASANLNSISVHEPEGSKYPNTKYIPNITIAIPSIETIGFIGPFGKVLVPPKLFLKFMGAYGPAHRSRHAAGSYDPSTAGAWGALQGSHRAQFIYSNGRTLSCFGFLIWPLWKSLNLLYSLVIGKQSILPYAHPPPKMRPKEAPDKP